MMSVRPTVIAMVLAVLSSVMAIVFWQIDSVDGRDRTESTSLLTADALPAANVDRIVLLRGGQPAFTFALRESGWMQVEPFEHPVDDFSMSQLIQAAVNLRVARTVDHDEQSEAALGFDPPGGVVRFQWNGGEIDLRLGRNSIGGRAYLQVGEGGPIHIVNNDLHDRALNMDPREWRLRRLFAHGGAESARVVSTQFGFTIVLSRDRRTWRMADPFRTRVDDVRLIEFLAEIDRAQHGGFILDQPTDIAAFGLTDPAAELIVETPVGESIQRERLIVGAPIGANQTARYAMVEGRPTVITISGEVLSRLFPDPETFIALSISGVQPENVKRIRISGPEGEFRLERSVVDATEQWISVDHGDQVVPERPVRTLIEMLTQFQATGILAEEYQPEFEVAVITLFGYDGAPLDAVRISRPVQGGDWFFDNGDGLQRLLPPSVDLPIRASHYGLTSPVR